MATFYSGKTNMESPFALKPIPFCLPAPAAFPTRTRGDAPYPQPGPPPPQDLRDCIALAPSALPQPKEEEVPKEPQPKEPGRLSSRDAARGAAQAARLGLTSGIVRPPLVSW